MPRSTTILDVHLPGHKVGQLMRDRHGLTVWEPSVEWEAQGQHPRLGVAFLRQPGRRKAGTGLPAWFENLLPERDSALRHRLCEAHGLREGDGLGLLRALGRDLSGAVEIVESEDDAMDREDAAGAASHDSGDHPAVLSEQLRFSLAGMQLKLSMSMANERLTLGASAGDTKWIVKLPSLEYQLLPEVEHATMAWARNAGFEVPGHFVVQTSALVGVPASWSEDVETAFAVRRFDRRDDGSKVHQEDLCQAFELLPAHKYGTSGSHQISHDGALRFVNDVAGEESAREMARRIGFTIACGPCPAMATQAVVRKRCSECRGWFRPAARVAKRQRVCGEECRAARRGRLARGRRAREPARYREEERERTRRSRQAASQQTASQRTAGARAGPEGGAGHPPREPVGPVGRAPGEARKFVESFEDFARMLDKVVEASRAGWERELRRTAPQFWQELRQPGGFGTCGHAPGGFSKQRR